MILQGPSQVGQHRIKIQFRRMEGQHMYNCYHFCFCKSRIVLHRKHSFPTVLFRTIYIHYADTNQQLHYLLFYLVVLTKETDAVAAVLLFIHIVHAQFSFLSNILLAFPDELQRQPQFCPLGTHSLCTYLFDSGIGRSKVNTFYVLPMSWAR